MKRLIILLFIIISTSAYSQKRSGFGLHAGSNSTGVYDVTNGYYDESQSSGYLVGLRYNIKLGPLGLSAEANYNSINYKSPPSLFNEISSDVNLNYLSVPILLKFYIGGFNIHLGTQISSLLGGSNQTSDDINSDENYVNINGNDEWIYNETDVAGVVGLGLDTKMGLYFSLRSVVSTSTIGNTSVYEDFFGFNPDDLLKLVTGSFIVGYQF
tara:strand:+ start:1043 stop:1678 length:636 start_codon:yes stop_codon:yes gene_type:complete